MAPDRVPSAEHASPVSRARADSLPPPKEVIPVLTQRQAEQQLILEYRRSGSRRDRDAVFERFLPLARSLARRYRRGAEPLEDLEQVAGLALVRAIEGFDPARDVAFSSYAVPTITGALKRHYRDYGWSVRVPRELQELAMRIQKFSDAAAAVTGETPTAAQVARQAGVSVEKVIEAREAQQALHADSLDRPRQSGEEDGSASLIDTMGAHDMAFRGAFDRVLLDSLLEALDEREQAIVRLYHLEELTQSEIGRRLGLSQMHISRLLRQATDKLATAAAEQSDIGLAVAA
jgi:RNA polymerase sigma-B factor